MTNTENLEQFWQPIAESVQQNIKGGQAGSDDDDLPDEIIWNVVGGTVSINGDDNDGFDIILFDIADVT